MRKPLFPNPPRKRRRLVWVPLLLLLASIYLFWIYPALRKDAPVKVEFAEDE